MKKIFTLLVLLMTVVIGAKASQTGLISGITLPDIPAGTINLASQTDFTADGNGWIVFNPYASLGSKNYWTNNSGNKTGATWSKPEGAVAPFVGASSSTNVHTLRNNRTYALRFTGAEKASFLVKAASSTKKAIISLYSYDGETQTLVGSAQECTSTSATEILFNSLTTSTNYIAYFYSNDAGSNSFVMEIALKAPVTTYTVTYKANDGTGEDVVDNKAAVVAGCPNTFTAPSGKAFTGWNTAADGKGTAYAVGASVTSNLTLYAQWATSHSVTYNLGAATAGTAPTQADVAEGKTFTVAAAPADLVAPTGKEFKCWNDGTTDYNPGDTYTMGTSNVTLTAVYQDKTYQGVTPAGTLDLSNGASTTFTTTWYTSSNMIKNSYYDAPNGVVAFSAFALYQGRESQTWVGVNGSGSTSSTWTATGNFKGNSYYFSSSPKAATARATERLYYFRVTNCTGVSALMGAKGVLEAYEVVSDVVSPDPVFGPTEISSAGTVSLTGLDANKEYIIKAYGNQNDNVLFQEIAFNFPAVTSVTATINPTYEWATFSCNYALDFSTVTDLEAYIVTGHEGTTITKQQVTGTVPAGTGLLLNGATASIPVAASSSTNVSSNLLKAGNGSEISAVSGKTRYVLGVEGGKAQFQKIVSTPATVPVGKAYLEFNEVIESRTFGFDDEVTAIKNIKVGTEDNIYYDLNGRRVLYPKKGLYIVNGKKVIVK